MALRHKNYLTLITIWYVLGFLYLSLYLYNFFPIKPKSHKQVLKPPDYINNVRLDVQKNYAPKADRIILMIIDALRYDFVTKNNMPYTYSKLNVSQGCLLQAKAESPTVTMPRLKAITTGNIPQFIDLILNFASTEITDDSFLHRARAAEKKMIFYGDNTWLKLFPNMFERSKGTTSFYVTDFTDVDNNVTRNLEKELKETDWDLLFLHYLGLDHIGHIHGPFHPLIKQKLQEMDDVINEIHTSLENDAKKTVILICGDHGMRDAGGHGGATDPEILVPLIFLGASCNKKPNRPIAQIDIAPTLSTLMGFELPADNIGKIILEIMNLTKEQELYLLHYNALNLLEKNKENIHKFKEIFNKHADYVLYSGVNSAVIIDGYNTEISKLSEKLIKNSTIQNVQLLYLSLIGLYVVLLALLLLRYQIFFVKISIAIFGYVLFLSFFKVSVFSEYFSIVYCGGIFLITLIPTLKLSVVFSDFLSSPLLYFLFFGSIIRTVFLLSSTYIEEEHHIWYYFWGSASILGAYTQIKVRKWTNSLLWITLFVGLRICRHLNYTGARSGNDDISNWLDLPENGIWVYIFFIIGLIGVADCCSKIFYKDVPIKILSYCTSLLILWYRNELYYDKHTVIEARIATSFIFITGIISYIKYKQIFKTFSLMWILWISLLMRPTNVILLPVCFWSSEILFKLNQSKKCLVLLHLWLGYTLFHCQGFGNSLSSVDISPGYIGLKEYSLFLTSFQVICHTYTFHVLSILLLFRRSNYYEQINMLHVLLVFRIFSTTWYCVVMLIHREHLFIWSVFSPKLLIEACHSSLLLIMLLSYILICRFIKDKF